jgi:hypothetical protein
LAVDRGASRTTAQRVPDEIGQRRSSEDARGLPRLPQKLTAALGDRRRLFGRSAALLRSRGGDVGSPAKGLGGCGGPDSTRLPRRRNQQQDRRSQARARRARKMITSAVCRRSPISRVLSTPTSGVFTGPVGCDSRVALSRQDHARTRLLPFEDSQAPGPSSATRLRTPTPPPTRR